MTEEYGVLFCQCSVCNLSLHLHAEWQHSDGKEGRRKQEDERRVAEHETLVIRQRGGTRRLTVTHRQAQPPWPSDETKGGSVSGARGRAECKQQLATVLLLIRLIKWRGSRSLANTFDQVARVSVSPFTVPRCASGGNRRLVPARARC